MPQDSLEPLNQEILKVLFQESTTHYRHLETLRKDYLSLYITLNAGVLAFKGYQSASGNGISLLNSFAFPMVMQVIALLFFIITRGLEEARSIHFHIQRQFYRECGVTPWVDQAISDSNYGYAGLIERIIRRSDKLLNRKTALLPYIVAMTAYCLFSLSVWTNRPHFGLSSYANGVAGLVTFIILVVCSLEFFFFQRISKPQSRTGRRMAKSPLG